MRRFQSRTILVVLLLVVLGVGPVVYVNWREQQTVAPSTPAPSEGAPIPYVYFIDVEGYYNLTQYERVVASPYDLSWDHLADFPMTIGEWRGSLVPVGPEITEWFDTPDIAVRRIYVNPRGQTVWLSFFGSQGRKSYTLFEHTPVTSYPAAGWTLLDSQVAGIALRRGPVYVQKAVLEKDGEQRTVLYWYLWNNPTRDPNKGLLTIRLHAVSQGNRDETLEVAAGFLRLLFPEALSWNRF
jgi:EpsI family protein